MYRLPTVSRSGRGLKPRTRSTSPTRNISQYAHSMKQAPIIPRYRPGGELYTVPAYMASHYNAVPQPTTTSGVMTPTATATATGTGSPMMKPISPKIKPVTPTSISPKIKPTPVSKAPKMIITPVMSPKMTGVAPKRSPTKVTPIPPITSTPIIPYPLSHYTDIITPTPAPTTIHPPYPLSHYTDVPVPSPITAPTTVHPPFPLPHYTDAPVPSPITAPTSIHPPYPLPHYTGLPVPSPITAPIGLPQPPYPLPHYTDIPIPSPINPSGYHVPSNPTSTPGMPWWMAAIGMGVAVGIAIVVAKERGETVVLPPMAVPSISIPEAAVLTMATSEVGTGTSSVLASISDKMSTTIIPPVKTFLQTLFSWVGMCGTFVFFCFVAVIRAKLFAGMTGTDSTGSTGSTGTVTFADGPTYIPPLDLASARISLDLSAKTYVEQLIAYYETLALTTDRMSLSQRKLMDDGFNTSKVHVD